jgi:hypothetical protein
MTGDWRLATDDYFSSSAASGGAHGVGVLVGLFALRGELLEEQLAAGEAGEALIENGIVVGIHHEGADLRIVRRVERVVLGGDDAAGAVDGDPHAVGVEPVQAITALAEGIKIARLVLDAASLAEEVIVLRPLEAVA